MIKTQLVDGREATILFRHYMKVENFPVPDTHRAEAKGYTQCEIFVGKKGEEEFLAGGESYYSASERIPYNRETGRKHALMRAVEGFKDENRVRLLKAYFNRPRPKGNLAQSVQREEPIINTDY